MSVENMSGPGMDRVQNGKDQVIAKSEWWSANNTVHSRDVRGPFPHGGSRFIVYFKIDLTPKGGERMTMEEAGLYTTEASKIIKEDFFYGMG